ncbi:hypothetical protein EV401DRAFT_1889372 [Pisolithus croceorrhizus]|nr:hypothetical protein EV401DRAFT_1889372 [Pisolithus croceorrhizus]
MSQLNILQAADYMSANSCWFWGVVSVSAVQVVSIIILLVLGGNVCTCCAGQYDIILVLVVKPMFCKYGSVFWDENAHPKFHGLEFYHCPESTECQSLPTPNYIMPMLPVSQSPAADPALSALVDIALTSVLWGSPLTPSSVIQRSDLQKPRLRVRSQLTNLQRCLEEEVLTPASFSSMELQLSALVIAFAILNPYVTEWDIDRFAEHKRNVEDKTKYFPYPQWGLISDPATILDVHGRVMVWYLPGIMSPARVVILSLPPPSILY